MIERPVKLACRHVWKILRPSSATAFGRWQGSDAGRDPPAEHVGAVRDVSLEVGEGEIFVIMGLSGSGKTTLVRCLSRLIEPTGGEILYDGEDLLKASPARMIEIRRHRMGMVFQHFALLPHLTVLENVAFPLEVQGMDRAAREARAREVVQLVGLQGARELSRASFRAGSSSASALPAALPSSRTCGSWMNPSARLTP